MKSLPYEIELCSTLRDLDLNSGKKEANMSVSKRFERNLAKITN